MSLMLMITMVKNLLSMSEGFGWQRYKKYLYQSLSCREIAFRTFHPLMQFLKNDVFDDFIGCLIV